MLQWSCGGEPTASIRHEYNLVDPERAWIKLKYRNKRDGDWVDREQLVALSYTVPHYGGRRWWMHCPESGRRVRPLVLPPGGDKFASREAWRLGYRSQRIAHADRPFEKLFRLQRKLGSEQGWEAGLYRPKGMWHRTFERHLERYFDLDERCSVEMTCTVMRLAGRLG